MVSASTACYTLRISTCRRGSEIELQVHAVAADDLLLRRTLPAVRRPADAQVMQTFDTS
jgi:hypothetical protein